MKTSSVSRIYKVSINVLFISNLIDSKSYTIPRIFVPYFIGFLFSLVNILTSIWGVFGFLDGFKGFRNTMGAISINLTGGEDNTKQEVESNYHFYTVYIYNNLERIYKEKISLYTVDIITDIQNLYEKKGTELYTPDNTHFFKRKLINLEILDIGNIEIQQLFNAMKLYEEHQS